MESARSTNSVYKIEYNSVIIPVNLNFKMSVKHFYLEPGVGLYFDFTSEKVDGWAANVIKVTPGVDLEIGYGFQISKYLEFAISLKTTMIFYLYPVALWISPLIGMRVKV